MAIQQDNPPTKGADAIQGVQNFPTSMSEQVALPEEEQAQLFEQQKEIANTADRFIVKGDFKGKPTQYTIDNKYKKYNQVIEFGTTMLNGSNVIGVKSLQEKTEAPVVLMDRDEFVYNFGDELSKQNVDPDSYYTEVQKAFNVYTSLKQASLPYTYGSVPDTEIMKDRGYTDDERSTRLTKQKRTDNKFYGSGGSFELYHADKEADTRNYYISKDGETILPLPLAKYKANDLKRVTLPTGESFWQESQDGELIKPQDIRAAQARTLTSTWYNTIGKGALHGVTSTIHGAFVTIPFALRAALDFSDNSSDKEFYKDYARKQNIWSKVHYKNTDQAMSAFESGNSLIYALSDAFAQIGGMLVMSGGSTGVLKLLTRGLEGTANKLAKREATKQLSRVLDKVVFGDKTLANIGMAIGNVSASGAVGTYLYNDFVTAGIDPQRAARKILPYMLATAASEFIFPLGQKVVSGRVLGLMNKGFKKVNYKKAANEMFDEKILAEVGDDVLDKGIKGVFKKVLATRGKWLNDLQKGPGYKGVSTRMAIQGGSEFLEEEMEGVMHSAVSIVNEGLEGYASEKTLEFYDKYNFYEQIVNGTKTGDWVMQSKDDENNVKILSKEEYLNIDKKIAKSERVLNGEKIYPSGVSLEEGVIAGLAALMTGGIMEIGNIHQAPTEAKDAVFQLAEREVKKGGARKEFEDFITKSIKKGEFSFFQDPEATKQSLMADFDMAVDVVRRFDIETNGRYNALRKGNYLAKEAYKIDMQSREAGDDIATLTSLSGELGEKGKVKKEQVNEKLGVVEGMTSEDLKGLIENNKEKQKALELKYKDVIAPEKYKAQNYDLKKQPPFSRERTDENVVVDNKAKQTSSRYSEILYDIEKQEKIANDLSKEKAKSLGKEEGTKAFKRKLEELKGSLYKGWLDEQEIYKALEAKGFGKESFVKKFKWFRDIYVSYLNDLSNTRQANKAFFESGELEETREIGGKRKDIVTEIGSLVEELDKLSSVEEVSGVSGTNLSKLKDRLIQANESLSTRQIQSDSKAFGKIEEVLSGLDSFLANPEIDFGDELNAFVDDIAREGGRLSGFVKGRGKVPQTIDVNKPSPQDRWDVMNMILETAREDQYKENGSKHPLMKEISALASEAEDENNFSGFADSEGAKNKAAYYLDLLKTMEEYIDENIGFVQEHLEINKETKEHSPLLEGNTKLYREGLNEFKSLIESERVKAKLVDDKSDVGAINRAINYQRSKMTWLNNDINTFSSLVEFLEDVNIAKEVREEIEKALAEINDLIKSPLKDGSKINRFNDLFQTFLDKKEMREEVYSIVHGVERKVFDLKNNLSGKLNPVIKAFNAATNNNYYHNDPGDTNIIFDRGASSLTVNKGLLSTENFEQGFEDFKALMDKKTLFRKERKFADWYYQQTLNLLNDINTLGQKDTPTFLQTIEKVRGNINKDTENTEDIPTYEQERSIVSIISYLYNPDNQFIKEGKAASDTKKGFLSDVLDRFLFLKGYGGSGKSTIVTKNVLKIYSQLKKEKLNVAIITPNESLQETQGKSLKDLEGISGKKFFFLDDVLDNPKLVHGYDIVILEEGTVIPAKFEKNIKEAVGVDLDSKWIVLGDDAQPIPMFQESGVPNANDSYILQRLGRKTTPLTEIFRNDLVDSRTLTNNIMFTEYSSMNPSKEYYELPISISKIANDKKKKLGVQQFNNTDPDITKNKVALAFLDYIKEYKEQKEASQVILIVLTTEDKQELLKLDKFKDVGHLIKTVEYPIHKIMEGGAKNKALRDDLVSGMEKEAVFFAADLTTLNAHKIIHREGREGNLLGYRGEKRAANVGTTRHKSYLAIVGNESNNKELDIKDEDTKVPGYGTQSSMSDYRKELKEHLVGNEEAKGLGGRYGVLLDGVEPFSEEESIEDIPDVDGFDRTIIITDEQGKKVAGNDEVKKKIDSITGKPLKPNRTSDLAYGTPEESLSEEEANNRNHNRTRHLLFNAIVNYSNALAVGTEKEQAKHKKAVDKAKVEYNKALKVIGSDQVGDGWITNLIKNTRISGITAFLEGNDDLTLLAPNLNKKVGDKQFTGQPNIVKIVGFVKGNKTMPIVDIINFRFVKTKDEPYAEQRLSTALHMALLIEKGFKINKVIDVGVTMTGSNDAIVDEDIIKYRYVYDDIDKVSMLSKGNALLTIEGKDKDFLASERELFSNEHYIEEHKNNDGDIIKHGTILRDSKMNKYFVHYVKKHIGTKGQPIITYGYSDLGDYNISTIKTKNSKNVGNNKGFRVFKDNDVSWYAEGAIKFKKDNKQIVYSTMLGGIVPNESLLLNEDIKAVFDNLLAKGTTLTVEQKVLLDKYRAARRTILTSLGHDDTFEKVLVTEKTKALAYDAGTGIRNTNGYDLYIPDELVYSVLLKHSEANIENFFGLIDADTKNDEVTDLIGTIRAIEELSGVMIPIVKDNVSTVDEIRLSEASDIDIFFAMGLDILSAQGQVEMDYKMPISSPKMSVENKDWIKAILKMDYTKAITEIDKGRDRFFNSIETEDGDDKYKQANIDKNLAMLKELWRFVNGKKVTVIANETTNGRLMLDKKQMHDVDYLIQNAQDNDYDYEGKKEGEPVFKIDLKQNRLMLNVWRSDSTNPLVVGYISRRMDITDIQDMLDGLELLQVGGKKASEFMDSLDITTAEGKEYKPYFQALDSTGFMNLLNYNKKFITELLSKDKGALSSLLRVQTEYESGKQMKSMRIRMVNPFNLSNAKYILNLLLKEKIRMPLWESKFLDNDSTVAKYIPLPKNAISSFQTLAQPSVYTRVSGESGLNKAYTGSSQEINLIFKENSQLSSIGSKNEYSSYLDSIFPDSILKTIMYHGSSAKGIISFDKSKFLTGEGKMAYGKGFYFTPISETAKAYKFQALVTGKAEEELLHESGQRFADIMTPELLKEQESLEKNIKYAFDEIEKEDAIEALDLFMARVNKKSLDKDSNSYSVLLNIKESMYWENIPNEGDIDMINEYLVKNSLYSIPFNPNWNWGIYYKLLDNRVSQINNTKVNDVLFGLFGFDSIVHITAQESIGYIEGVPVSQQKDEKQIIVFEPTNIHILGSENDIKGFTKFVKDNVTLMNKSYDSSQQTMISQDAARKEIEHIAGKTTNSDLFFHDGIFKTRDGTEVWGNIVDAIMTLSTEDGLVSREAARHEAMHKVMLHLLKPSEYNKVMKEAMSIMKKKGLDLTGTTNERNIKINEYIAEQFESREPLSKTYFGKFIKWIRNVVNNLFKKRNALDRFMDTVDNGFYSGRTVQFYENRDFSLNMIVEDKYSSKEAHNAIEEVFGTVKMFDSVLSNHIIPKWMEFSPYSRNFKKSKANWHDTLKDMANHYTGINDEVGTKKVSVYNIDGTKIFTGPVSDMLPEHYTAASIGKIEYREGNKDAIKKYEEFQLGDKFILNSMIKVAFPEMSIELLEKTDVTSSKGKETYDKQNVEVNPLDSKSAFFTMMLSTIPLYNINGERIKDAYIPFRPLNKLMIDAYRTMMNRNDKEGFIGLLNTLSEKLEVSVVDTQTQNIIYSFLKEYGNDVTIASYSNDILTGRGYYSIANSVDSKLYSSFVRENNNKGGTSLTKGDVIAKKQQISSMLKVIDSFYSSLTTYINTWTEWNSNGDISEVTAFNLSDKWVKDKLKKDISSTLFDSNTNKNSPQTDVLITDKYKISLDGKVYLKDGKTNIQILKQNNFSVTEALDVLNDLGLELMTPDIVSAIYANNKRQSITEHNDIAFGNSEFITGNDLQSLLSDMLLAVKFNTLIKKDMEAMLAERKQVFGEGGIRADLKKNWSVATYNYRNTYNKILQEKYRSIDSIQLSDIKMAEMNNLADQIVNDLYPSPINFWQEIENSFVPLIKNEMNELTTRVTQTVDGKYAYSHPLGSFLTDLIPVTIGASTVLGNTIADEIVEEGNYDKNPLYRTTKDGTVIWNNPIMNGLLKFDYYDNFDGIEVNGDGIKYFDLEPYDLMKNFMEGMILHSVETGKSKIPVFMDTNSDKPSNYIFNIYRGGLAGDSVKSWVKYKRKEDLIEMSIDKEQLVKAMSLIADYHVKLNKLAKGNWKKIEALIEGKQKPNAIRIVEQSEFVSGRDYIITGKGVEKGNAVEMVDNGSETSPYLALSSILSDNNLTLDTKYQKVLKSFKIRYKHFTDLLEQEGYEMPEHLQKELDGGKWGKGIGEINDKWNPLYESAFFLHTLFNDSINPLIRNSSYTYGKKGTPFIDYLKRAGFRAPGTKYSVDENLSAMGKHSKALIANDVMLNDLEVFDGLIPTSPWFHSFMKMDSGDDLSSVSEGMVKNVNYYVNPVTGETVYHKAAMLNMSPTHIQAPLMQGMLKLMLGEMGNKVLKTVKGITNAIEKTNENELTIFEEYISDYSNFNTRFTHYLLSKEGKQNRKDFLVDYVVFKSASKTNNSKIIDFGKDYNTLMASPEIDITLNNKDNVHFIKNKHMRLQQVTSQDTIDQFKTIATQLLFIMGALDHNSNEIAEINEALQDISEPLLEKLQSLNTREEQIVYLKELGKERSFMGQDSNRFIELIGNTGIDVNVFRKELTRVFSNSIRDGILPSLPGQNYIQSPYFGLIYWLDDQPLMQEDYNQLSSEDQARAIPSPLRHQGYNDNGSYSPSQIIIPFNYVIKFGIEKDVTMAQAMSIQFIDEKGQVIKKNLYGLDRKQISQIITNDNSVEVFNNILVSQRNVIDESHQRDIAEYEKNVPEDQDTEYTPLDRTEKLINYFDTFNQSLDALGVRIPTSNASSAFMARVVGFDNYSDNTVYVPVEKSIWDGSDYDIDALSIYFRNISKDLKVRTQGKGGSQNQIFEAIKSYYENIANKPLIQERIDLTFIQERADKMDSSLYAADFATMVKSLVFGREGKKLVGHFANLENAIARILSLPESELTSMFGGKGTIVTEDKVKLIGVMRDLANLINAATDNENLGGALGRLNINQITSPLLAGLIFQGKSLEQVIDIINNDEVKEATLKAHKSKKRLNNLSRKNKVEPLYVLLEAGPLKEAAYIGEGLRRFAEVLSVQRNVPTSIEDIWWDHRSLQINIGKPLLTINRYDGEEYGVKEQIKYITGISPFDIYDTDEEKIRGYINIDRILSAKHFQNYRNILLIFDKQYGITEDSYIAMNPRLKDKILEKLNSPDFFSKKKFKDYTVAVDNKTIGMYLSTRKINFNGVHYDLGMQRGRYEFVMVFPDYVKTLKASLSNEFINDISIVGTKTTGGNKKVEMSNSSTLSSLAMSLYQQSFEALSPDVKTNFELYNLLVYGFARSGGSMGDLITNEETLGYSSWLQDDFQKLFENDDFINAFTDDLLINTSSLLQEYPSNSEDAIAEYYGITTAGRKFVVDATRQQHDTIKSSLYNTYLAIPLDLGNMLAFVDINKSSLKDFHENKSKRVKLFLSSNTNVRKVRFFDKPSYSNLFITGNETVVLPDGSQAQITVFNDTHISLTNKWNKEGYLPESKIKKVNAGIAEDLIDVIVTAFQKSFPNIRINKVNDVYAQEQGKTIAWIENGEVFINVDRIQTDTLMHEFIGHIFIDILQETNPAAYESLMSEAIEILNRTSTGKAIESAYSNLDRSTLLKEIIANMIGWNSMEDVSGFLQHMQVTDSIEYAPGLWNRIKDNIQKLKNSIMEFVNRAFGVRLNVNISTATLNDIAKNAVKAIKNGDVISYVSSKTYDKLNNSTIYESKIEDKKASNITEVLDLLETDSYARERAIHRIELSRNKYNDGNSGLDISIADIFYDMMIDETTVSNEDAYDRTVRNEHEFTSKFVELLNTVDPMDQEFMDKILPYSKKYKQGIYTPEVVSKILRAIGYDSSTKYYRYSDWIKDSKYTKYASEDLIGRDPIIAVQVEGKDKDGKDLLAISIFDVTPNAFDNGTTESMFTKYGIKSPDAKARIGFLNNKRDHSRFMMSMLFNKLMAVDPTLTIRNVSLVEVFSTNMRSYPVYHQEVNNYLNEIAKIKPFMDAISSNDITSVLSEKKHYPDQNAWEIMIARFQELSDRKEASVIGAMLTDDGHSIEDRIQIVLRMLKELEANKKSGTELTLEEYTDLTYLSNALAYLRQISYASGHENALSHSVTSVETWVWNSGMIGDKVFQRMKELKKQATGRLVEEHKGKKKILKEIYKDLLKIWERNPNKTILNKYKGDVSAAVWDQINVKITDVAGNKRSIGAVYWTNNVKGLKGIELLMAQQAKDLGISKELLSIGKRVTEFFEEELKTSIYYKKINNTNTNHWYNTSKKRPLKREDITFNDIDYFKGMMPLMKATSSEAATQWKLATSLKKIWNNITDMNEIFDFNKKDAVDTNKDFNLLDDMFNWQFASSDTQGGGKTSIGNKNRVKAFLGIREDFSREKDTFGLPVWETIDGGSKTNDDVSRNMSKVLDYYTATTLRKKYYETEILPIINGAKMQLEHINEYSSNPELQGAIKNSIRYLEFYTMQTVRHTTIKWGNDDLDKYVRKGVMGLGGMVAPLTMMFNINVATIGLASNAMFASINAAGNSLVENGIFNLSDLTSSHFAMNNFSLIRQLMFDLQVMNSTEVDLLNSWLWRYERNDPWSKFMINAPNWAADYFARGLVMVAQMKHDGKWDAYSTDKDGNVLYDEKKDKEIWTYKDGKHTQTKDQIIFREALLQELLEDNVYGQTIDGPLVRGYSIFTQAKLKEVADTYAVGAFDAEGKQAAGLILFGRMFQMFKTWAGRAMSNAFGRRDEISALGRRVIEEDMYGNRIAKWEPLEVEGYMRTLGKMSRLLLTGHASDIRMGKVERTNMKRVAAYIATYGFGMLLYTLLFEGWDDDDDKKRIEGIFTEYRLTKNIKYALESLNIFHTTLEWAISPFASTSIATRYVTDPMGNLTLTGGRRPFEGQINTFTEFFEEKE